MARSKPRDVKPSNESASDVLRRGREDYLARAWRDAYDALCEADREGALGWEDLERLAVSAGLIGDDEKLLETQERLHPVHLDAGRELRAPHSAFLIRFPLMSLREMGRAPALLPRAERTLQ